MDDTHAIGVDLGGTKILAGVVARDGSVVRRHERATPQVRALTPAGNVVEQVQLELSQRRVPAHMNKFGKPYGRASNDGY